MDMKKKALIAAAALLAVAGGYVGFDNWAADKADREVRRMLVDLNLDRAIRYRAVSASVFGNSITLRDVELRDAEGRFPPATAQSLHLSELDLGEDQLHRVRLHFSGLSLPILDALRDPEFRDSVGKDVRDLGEDVVGVGYTRLKGDVTAFLGFDAQKRLASTEVGFDFEELGAAKFKLTLAGLDERDQRLLRDYYNSSRDSEGFDKLVALLSNARQIADFALRLELSELEISIKDRGLRQRLVADEAETQLITEDADKLPARFADRVRSIMRKKLDDNQVDSRTAEDIAATVASFVEKGGQLRMISRIDRPIPLFERGGVFGIEPAPVLSGFDRFLSLTGTKIES